MLDKRIVAHRAGRGALFTKMDPPVRLLAAKLFQSKGEALQVERQVKRVGATHKMRLAEIWSEQNPIDQITQERLSLV